MKKIILFFLIIGFLLSAFGFAFAKEESLELKYPEVGGYQPEVVSTPLGEYVKYIFNFAIWIVGFIAFGVLIMAGVKYLVSAGNPTLQSDARSQTSSALLGIAILLFSVVILTKVNPQLIIFSETSLPSINNYVFADVENEERELELKYPQIPGAEAPETVSTPLDKYVKYIFNFAIWIIGIVALGVIIIAGVKYVLSIGNPALQSDARNQLFSVLLGVLILISSVVIFNRINPQLTTLSPASIVAAFSPEPGIWLCKKSIEGFESFMEDPGSLPEEEREEKEKEIGENCYRLLAKSPLREDFKEEVKQVYLIPNKDADYEYGVVLHEKEIFEGFCWTRTSNDVGGITSKVRSATPFIIEKTASGEGITLYKYRDFNEEIDPDDLKPKDEQHFTADSTTVTVNMDPCYSIKIDEEKNWVAIVYKAYDPSYWGAGNIFNVVPCEVFHISDRNLEDDYVSTFCGFHTFGYWWYRRPCVKALRIFKGKVIETPE